MTTKEKASIMMLVGAFVDASSQAAVNIYNDTLRELSLDFNDFKDFMKQLPQNQDARFIAYDIIRNLSPDDKNIVRRLIVDAYSKGGKQGTQYALYYFKEIIENCNLANAIINI